VKPEAYARLKELFFSALELPEGERAAWVEKASGTDPELHERLTALLDAAGEEGADGFLETPPALPAGLLEGDDEADSEAAARAGDGEPGVDLEAGTRLGPWEIVRPVGRGGMGTVYEARRAEGDFVRRAAVKVIRPEIATGFFLRRFRTERRILAGLDHPNIARLLDAGATEGGLPYVVLEYVEGRPLLEHCEAQDLDLADRLRLFRQVCDAVDHAHRSLVVHRDLKPGNILVAADGTPKLLDFGIAKLLELDTGSGPDDVATRTHLRLMTPDYASPEQLTGGRITTATDVYSLGVVLYELLTRRKPYDFKTHDPLEVARVVAEREPLRPSQRVTSAGRSPGGAGLPVTKGLAKRLRGDLDNIVMTAMRREPERRYASAQQLSDDILRYLEDRPIVARRDTLGYRTLKLVRRHRVGVAAAVLAAAALVAGFVVTLQAKRVAEVERARAQRRFNDVRKLAGSFLFEFHDAIQTLPGSTPARALVVRRALEYLDGLVPESGEDPALRRELAAAYQKVGDVQGERGAANLGDTPGALASYRKALEIRESLASRSPHDADLAGELAATLDSVGDVLAETGDSAGSFDAYQRSMKVRQAMVASDPKGVVPRRALATSYHKLASALVDRGEYADALPMWRREGELFEALWKENPTDRRAQRNVALACKYTGGTLEVLNDPTAALGLYERAVALDEARSAADPTNASARIDLSFSYGAMSLCLASMGEVDCGLEAYRKAFEIRRALAEADPKNVNAQMALARAYLRIGELLAMKRDTTAARESYGRSLAIEEALSRSDPSNEAARERVAVALDHQAKAEMVLATDAGTPERSRAGHWRDARAIYRRSLDIWQDQSRRHTLRPSRAGEPERVAKQIALCDEALAGR
jgi:non-specific serine/threonine protein kinase/serine/threonine-protein kinase